jgi:hypothetical protein
MWNETPLYRGPQYRGPHQEGVLHCEWCNRGGPCERCCGRLLCDECHYWHAEDEARFVVDLWPTMRSDNAHPPAVGPPGIPVLPLAEAASTSEGESESPWEFYSESEPDGEAEGDAYQRVQIIEVDASQPESEVESESWPGPGTGNATARRRPVGFGQNTPYANPPLSVCYFCRLAIPRSSVDRGNKPLLALLLEAKLQITVACHTCNVTNRTPGLIIEFFFENYDLDTNSRGNINK